MIIARERHAHSACFDEIDAAVSAMLAASQDPRLVIFNAHSDPNSIPPGSVVFNLENVELQVSPVLFQEHEIWDFSLRNVERWRRRRSPATFAQIRHVPIGHHASMERFTLRSWRERDIDVVFTGAPNPRRALILDALRRLGYRVLALPWPYGSERDALLARARVAVCPLYYPDGLFPVLRSAHSIANGLPIIAEAAAESPVWHHPPPVPYDEIVGSVDALLAGGESAVTDTAENAYARFRASPLSLPPAQSSVRPHASC